MFLLSESVPGIGLSLTSFKDGVITFQIILTKTSRFIKFDYDCETDTLEKVAAELIAENITESSSMDAFIEFLDRGIKKTVNKGDPKQIAERTTETRN